MPARFPRLGRLLDAVDRSVASLVLCAVVAALASWTPAWAVSDGNAPSSAATDGPSADWPATLEGHGGPVKSVAIRGTRALTASFDYAATLWSLDGAEAPLRLLGHRAAVNDAAFHGSRAITASDDSSVMVWNLDTGEPVATHSYGGEKVIAVAVSPDGTLAASAHWDNAARLFDLTSGTEIARLDGHTGNVNDVAFSGDGNTLFTASYDGTILEWDLSGEWSASSPPPSRPLIDHGWGINVVAPIARNDGDWLLFGAVDGSLKSLPLADLGGAVTILEGDRPVMALAVSPDGTRFAAGDGAGFARLFDTNDWSERGAVSRPGPVWGLAFADENHLYLAGLDDRAFLWRASPNAPFATPPETFPRRFQARSDDPGERQFARKCSVCHTLTPDDGNRAGPTLHGLFGRPVASLPDYSYSDAMRALDIVWTAETVGLLFEHGPDNYTPGSKMPMQRIVDDDERLALVRYLERATAPGGTEATTE